MAKSSQKYRRTFLKEWRIHRDLTQAQLAEAMDISETYLSDLERGIRRYNQDMLETAAEALNCSVVDLLTRKPAPAEGKSEDVWSMLSELDEADRQRAAVIISTLKR
ncbi:helix-turn-helix transcriptional regulator [Hyphomonas sp.]|uniref:helix-turn-helix domain-containing protein n=1 Tax=Hyphomonas sp. TaxID=87 RepID=UPI0025BB0BCD|nr:helix-turn-helix transcriptional regulator [Hyphomonas sp.]